MMPTPTATIFVPYHALDEVHQRGTRASQPAASAVVPGTLYAVTDEGTVIERSSGTAWEAYSPVPSGGSGGGTGDVVGPASAVDNSVAVYSGTTGKLLKDASQVTVDGATGNLTTPGSLTAGGLATTPLNASNLTSGTVANARLSAQVARTDVENTFTQNQRFEKAAPVLKFVDTAAAANARIFRLYQNNQVLSVDAVSDDEATLNSYPLRLNRGGDVSAYRDLYEKQRGVAIGHWTDMAYNPANFSAAAGTWTVDAGDVGSYTYMLVGKTLILTVTITASSTSVSTQWIAVALPAGFTVARTINAAGYGTDGSAWQTLDVHSSPSFTAVIIDRLGGTPWPAVTNALSVRFQIAVNIT
jgi:hypothetical protein